MADPLHAAWQRDVLERDGTGLLETRQVDFDELGQCGWQAVDFEFSHDVADQVVFELDGIGLFFTLEVERHLHVHAGRGIDALEVDVLDHLAERMVLHVAQQHLADSAVDFHFKNRCVKRFFLEGKPQCVVIDFDHLWLDFATVDDARGTAGNAKTAARTRPLQGALKSDKVHD